MLSRFTQERLWRMPKPKGLICKSFVLRFGVGFLLFILFILMCGCYYSPPDKKERQSTQPTPQNEERMPELTTPPSMPSPTADVHKVRTAMGDGDYGQVRNFLERGRQTYQENPGLKALYDKLTNPLKVEMEFHYSRGRRPKGTAGLAAGITKNDPYWLIVKTFDSCYLYILQRDSSGRFQPLFPNTDYSSLENPVEQGVIRLPDSYGQFHLDDTPGTETIYLIASRWEQNKLKRLMTQVSQTQDSAIHQNVDEILALMRKADEHTARIGGLAYYSYSFQHVSAPSAAE